MASGHEQMEARRSRNAAQHQCDYCQVTFTRSEHLKRHQTMHDKLKAFSCSFCDKKFARSDVLNRHYQSCQPAQQVDRAQVKLSQRVNRACSSCRLSKVRCSGSRPCDRCCSMGRGDLCQFTLRKPRQANAASGNPVQNQNITRSPEQRFRPYQSLGNRANDNTAVTTENGLVATELALDQQTQSNYLLQQTPESFDHNITSDDVIEAGVELELDQATMTALSTNSVTEGLGFPDNTATFLDFSDIGDDTTFDLDPLDWGLLDNSLMSYQMDDQDTTATTSSSPDQILSLPSNTAGRDSAESGVRREVTSLPLPPGIDMMQISPLEAHRIKILRYIEHSGLEKRRWESWLTVDNMSLFIYSYFSCFHQHTPLLHLPSWNITTSSTALIFSIVLMGSMYSGNLKSHSSNARQLCHLAESFAWESDSGLETNGVAQLDTIQSVYIAILLEAFYFPPKEYPPGVSMTKIVTEARKAGVFQSVRVRTVSGSCEPKWLEWSTQECRIRTAFILYLFDAIQAILFDRRPEIQLHELSLPLPCDESAFSATTQDKWYKLYLNSRNMTKLEYPVVLSLFLCHQPTEVPLRFSVMGAFTILHGILLHMWEQRSIRMQKETSDIPDTEEEHVRNHLAAAQGQVINNALQLWKVYWNKIVSQPASMSAHGLYRDRALVYWFLGNAMNRRNGSLVAELPTVSANGQRTLKIPHLLKRLSVMIDSGRLGEDVSDGEESLDSCLRDLQESRDTEAVEEVDTIILSCMMRKGPGKQMMTQS